MSCNQILDLMRSTDLSVDDLRKINAMAVQLSKTIGRSNIHNFNVGDQVQFTNNKNGKVFVGRLIKINRTKAQVKVDNLVWNVPFSFLKSA